MPLSSTIGVQRGVVLPRLSVEFRNRSTDARL